LKELGNYLKTTREANGVSIDEAADDLKIDVFLLESLEEGNTRAFKDMLGVRDIVRDYSKYLGLKSEEVIDEYNDFLFEHTSKISLKDIMEAEKKDEKKQTSISSPYTYIRKKKRNINNLKIVGLWALIVAIIIIIITLIYLPKKEPIVTELMIGCDYNEKLAK
jgi:cytoskeletal protein RodZ